MRDLTPFLNSIMENNINKVRIRQKGIKSSRNSDEYRNSEEYSVAVYT